MSTWQLFSDKENQFHWEISDQELVKEDQCHTAAQRRIDVHRLPSMADLLLLGSSRLVANGKGNLESPPMFRTGSGKSVALKQSSIAKARSVLGDVDGVFTDTGKLDERKSGYHFLKLSKERVSVGPANAMKSRLPSTSDTVDNMSNSMFQTGSGKTVGISSTGLLRAKALLGLEDNYDDESFHSSKMTQQQSISTKHPALENPLLETDERPNLNFTSTAQVLDSFSAKSNSFETDSKEFPVFINRAANPPPVKFHTAGGRSISVSSEALQRARSLLGNPEFDSFLNETSTTDLVLATVDNGKANCSSDPKIDFRTPFSSKEVENGDNSSRNFTSPLRSSSYQKQSLGSFEKLQPGSNLITKFDAAVSENTETRAYNDSTCNEKPLENYSYSETVNCLINGIQMKSHPLKSSSNRVLVDISNSINIEGVHDKQSIGEKRRHGRTSSVSQFKKPRSSFVAPLSKNNYLTTNVALSRLAPKEPCCKERVSMRFPHQNRRPYLKEYILHPPSVQRQLEDLPKHVRRMNPNAAENYIFQNKTASGTGPDDFHLILSQSGASNQHLTKEWVLNHYKWIVWKLACFERCYPNKFSGKLLTVSNVVEELKYRYELEVNHGHRSAIRKILDGDAPPSSMMVLCISSFEEHNDAKFGPQSALSDGVGNGGAAKIELTDGWYSLKAVLDEHLSKKLAAGKLFLGQKIRIWGAKLLGWAGPISPSEASQTAGLLLHINGTYRCHWAERLGFCKNSGFPLAFRCIKATGGTVPNTLVGVTRLYPVLYRERLTTGSFIVRSERMEAKVLQLYNQRRSAVAEGIMYASPRGIGVDFDEHDCEGARIMKLLEAAAEPEILMAGMSTKQLATFSAYKAKLVATRQSNMQKSIEKALEAAGLGEREVTPFLRVRVVGLENKCCPPKYFRRSGLITIWNPTEKQKLELCEGQAYAVGGLLPSSSDSGTLYLQARGSTTNWIPLPSLTMEIFEPFFTPRTSITISNFGEVPLCSEFDIAAFVIYVGEVYTQGQHRKQWVFVTDGSKPEFSSKESSDGLLAISFCLPYIQCDSSAPVNSNIAGSVVGFCNLIKRPRDRVNGLWVADATENSDYFVSYDHASGKHLKDDASSVSKWAKMSSLMINKRKEHILSMIRNSKR